ncbi:unnamed protein product [Brassica oleracea var. botrytis]|uniref:Uncharacterized protein n=2 Tax=Brassica TaxID=3705 RepID=A0A3P6BG98_BRAOL|nr:unnamed protein product [Brassica napus]VDC96840.1 unnamed protein product [Brassica oleracea]
MGGGPRVLVATSINPQIVGGRLFLNATSGTHIYFDKETTARETYFYRLVAQDTRLPSAAPLLKSYAKVESLSIAELNEFVISASSRAGDGVNPEDTQAPPFVAGMDGRPTHSSEGDRMPLSQFVDNGSDDDNGNNNSGAISVRSKVETGGSSQVQGSSEVKKKARKA